MAAGEIDHRHGTRHERLVARDAICRTCDYPVRDYPVRDCARHADRDADTKPDSDGRPYPHANRYRKRMRPSGLLGVPGVTAAEGAEAKPDPAALVATAH